MTLVAHNESLPVSAPAEMGSLVLRIGNVFGFRFQLPDDSSDVCFVGESKGGSHRIAAHKCVLSTFSPVFFHQFNVERKDMSNEEIPVPKEYKCEAFSAAIDIMYGREVSVGADAVSDMYALACTYKLDCVKWALAQSIPQWGKEAGEPVLKWYRMMHSADVEEKSELLKAAVFEYVHGHLGSLTESDALCDLSQEMVLTIARSEDISASELELCKFLSKWAAAHDTMPAKDLDEIFRHVRYGTIAYSEVLSEMGTHKFFVGSGERFAIAYSQLRQLNLATLKNHTSLFIPRRAQSCATYKLPIFSNTREQVYAFVFADQRNGAICVSWDQNVTGHMAPPFLPGVTPPFLPGATPPFLSGATPRMDCQPSIEVQVKSVSSVSRSESFSIALSVAGNKSNSNTSTVTLGTGLGGGLGRGHGLGQAPAQDVTTQPIHAVTLQLCADGIKYCKLVKKEPNPNLGELQTASCTVISFTAPLPWLVEMKQKHMHQPLKLERI